MSKELGEAMAKAYSQGHPHQYTGEELLGDLYIAKENAANVIDRIISYGNEDLDIDLCIGDLVNIRMFLKDLEKCFH